MDVAENHENNNKHPSFACSKVETETMNMGIYDIHNDSIS